MNCAIIGAGQLGSRHLQGLLGVRSQELEIFVIDPNQDSLDIASKRANEVEHTHKVTYNQELSHLPSNLEFVVVATNSKVRLRVIEELIGVTKVKYLILEKVLFPSVDEYDAAMEMVKQNEIQCWVNHPRRMYQDYKTLKEHLQGNRHYSFQLLGSAWGLACNALHFIDLFELLSDSQLNSVFTEYLENKIIESKRSGYIEFQGTINGILGENNQFTITSLPNSEIIAPSISIMAENTRIFIQESGSACAYVFDKEKNFQVEQLKIGMKFQSQLTGLLFENLIETGTCDLPMLNHSVQTHKIFIHALLQHWNKITGENKNYLPIT